MSCRMPERTTVRLPDDLMRRAKRKAVADGTTVTALIEEGLRRVLSEQRSPRRAKRILPPVSTATGGLMPGIDINDTAALAEMDDSERLARPL